MRTKVVTITLLCLILLASIGWPAAIAQSAQEAAETREQRGDPEPLYLPKTMRPGFYAARDNRNLPASEYHLVGGHQSFRWDRLEPTEDNYQWQYIDDFINAQLAAGKQAVGIGIVTYGGRAEGGNAVPSWVFAQKGARKIVCSGGHEIPRYWDAVYLREYEDFIADLAARYDNDPRVEFVQIGVGLYMETQPSQGSSDDACVEAAMQADGKTRWSWPYMVNDIIDIYRRHFQNTTLLLLSEPTFYNIEADRQKWMDHAVHNGVGLQPAGLHADREWVDLRKKTSGGNSWHGFGKYDYMLDQAEENAFMTWNPVPMAHEAYDYMFGGRTDQGALPDERQFFWGIAAGLSRKVDYITIERNALYVGQPNDPTVTPIASHLRFMEWASQYMGKYVTTVNSKDGRTYERTPSVWVLLRESAYPSNLYPQEGNYSFWLLQDDNVSGGRTKVVTYRRESELDIIGNMTGGSLATRPEIITVDDDPSLSVLQNRDPDDPMDTSPSYKGWICRRTDQATGNRRMYFKIDDRYYYGGPTQATITITYFDRGTDSWKLVGHDASGTEVTLRTITKGNTDHWETAISAICCWAAPTFISTAWAMATSTSTWSIFAPAPDREIPTASISRPATADGTSSPSGCARALRPLPTCSAALPASTTSCKRGSMGHGPLIFPASAGH